MHNLSVASASLSKFQKLAFGTVQSLNERPELQTSNESRTVHPEYKQASDTALGVVPIRRKGLCREDSSTPLLQSSHDPSTPVFPRSSPDVDSECCGGLLNCDHLLDKDPDSNSNEYIIERDPVSTTTSRLSGLRSTSDYRLG